MGQDIVEEHVCEGFGERENFIKLSESGTATVFTNSNYFRLESDYYYSEWKVDNGQTSGMSESHKIFSMYKYSSEYYKGFSTKVDVGSCSADGIAPSLNYSNIKIRCYSDKL